MFDKSSLFYKTNPIFPHFSTKNNDSAKKQTQYKPNSKPKQTQSNPFLAQKSGGQSQTKPIQNLSQVYPRENTLLARNRGMWAYLLFCRGANFKELK
jgi:hypothetical protein